MAAEVNMNQPSPRMLNTRSELNSTELETSSRCEEPEDDLSLFWSRCPPTGVGASGDGHRMDSNDLHDDCLLIQPNKAPKKDVIASGDGSSRESHNLQKDYPKKSSRESHDLQNDSPQRSISYSHHLHDDCSQRSSRESNDLHNDCPQRFSSDSLHLHDDFPHNRPNKAHKPAAPDGGFGWFVVLGCFIAHVVHGGLDRSEGVYFLLLTSQFGENAQLTSWPWAITSTLQLVLGPLANVISFRYSVRVSVFLGGALMFIGLVLSSFATNIYFYFISHAIIDGVGRGISYVPGLIIVGMYFDKRSGLAAGLATSGVGLGTFLIVPLSQYLSDNYGFQGTFLILGGLSCNIFVAGMLYRPISMHYRSVERRRARRNVQAEELIDKDETKALKESEMCEATVYETENVRESFSAKKNIVIPLELQIISYSPKTETCQNITPSPKSEAYHINSPSPKSETCQNITPSPKSETYHSNSPSPKSEACQNITPSPKSETCQNITPSSKSETYHINSPSPKSETCENITPSPKSETCENITPSPKSETYQRMIHSSNCYSNATSLEAKEDSCMKSSLRICFPIENTNRQSGNSFRLDLLTKPSFLLYCVSIFAFTMAFRAAFTFLPALMESKGIPKWQSALALSCTGAVDTFGRIGAGLLVDLPKLRPVRLFIYSLFIFGVSFVAFILPSLSTFSSFCVMSSFYGLLTGAYISQKSVVLADILDSSDLANSFGILMVFQGLGSLLGPPVAGAFKDSFGDFGTSFYLGGGLLIVSAILMVLCHIFTILQKRKLAVHDRLQVVS